MSRTWPTILSAARISRSAAICSTGPDTDTEPSGINRGDRDVVQAVPAKEPERVFRRELDRRHSAQPGQPVLVVGAFGDHANRVHQRYRARYIGSRDFAHRMAVDGVRLHAEKGQDIGERRLDREQQRLRDLGVAAVLSPIRYPAADR